VNFFLTQDTEVQVLKEMVQAISNKLETGTTKEKADWTHEE